MIQKFQTLSELLASLSTLESNEWIYTEIAMWNSEPHQAIFLLHSLGLPPGIT